MWQLSALFEEVESFDLFVKGDEKILMGHMDSWPIMTDESAIQIWSVS